MKYVIVLNIFQEAAKYFLCVVQGKLPLSGLSVTKPDIDPDTSKDCFEISGDPKIFSSQHHNYFEIM